MHRSAVLILGLLGVVPHLLPAQEAHVGLLGGATRTDTFNDDHYQGARAGLFVQTDLSKYLAVRSEASWMQTAVVQVYQVHGPSPVSSWAPPNLLEYAEVNLQARLFWRSGSLPLGGFRIGFSAFGGGVLGARTHGDFWGEDKRRVDLGHLMGLGFSWWWDPFVFQVEARAQRGDRSLYRGGPNRQVNEWVFGVGYRIR